jgi:RHS repeat-associated protein
LNALATEGYSVNSSEERVAQALSSSGINNLSFEKQDVTNQLYAPGDLALPPTSPLRKIAYDAAGNQTKDTYTGHGTATFDGENHITAIQNNQSGWSTYGYDGSGQRIKRTTAGVETWQVYGFGGELVAEYPANAASPQKEYGYRNGQLLVTAEPAATTPPTNVALASNGATVTASSTYSGFAASGTINGDRKGLFSWQDGWWSTASAGAAWLEVQFNGSKTISEIDVVTVQDNYNAPVEPTDTMTFSTYGLTSFEVQYWTGSAWATISGNITGNNKVWRKFTFTPLTTTKIKVLANASPDGYGRLAEVEAWTGASPAPRYDLALGASVTASSNYAGWGPVGTVNGDRKSLNTYNDGAWSSATGTFPQWVQVDFGTNKTIAEIDVFTLQDNYAGSSEPTEAMTFTQWGLTGYEVQYWDGANWVTVPGGSISGNNKIWRKFTFSPLTTSKIRVLTNASIDGYSRLTEIEAYGPIETASNGVHWLITDHLGTPRMVLDQSGDLDKMTRHDYLPFGEELFAPTGGRSAAQGYASGDGVRQRFTQKERDNETGLDYFGARYYASTQGRFTGADSIAGNPYSPQSLNLYTYVLNNPLALIDPDGYSSDLPCNFGGSGLCVGKFQDPNTSNVPPAKNPGDPIPVASCAGCGSPFGKIAELTIGDGGPQPITTSSDVTATSVIERQPVLQTSALDLLPVYGSGRQFLFDYTTHNFEHALLSFGHLALDLSPLGAASRARGVASLGIEVAPQIERTAATVVKEAAVTVNRTAGNAFRDEIGSLLEAAGFTIRKEVTKFTPFGRRVIDIEVSKGGQVLGGIETKLGKSAYKASQRAKDYYLRTFKNYPVNLIRSW